MATYDNSLTGVYTLRPLILRLLGIALIATSLTACETTGGGDGTVEVVQTAGAEQPLSEPEMQKAYSAAIASSTDSRVEVFSLDKDMTMPPVDSAYGEGAIAAMAPPAPRLPQGQGRSYGGDSNILVFPLDDNAPSYGAYGEIPSMIPPTPMPVPSPLDHSQAVIDDMAKIYFAHGQSSLSADGVKVVSSIADQCRGGGCGIVRIDGHASTRAEAKDEVQRRLINLKISMDRAMNVSRQLIRNGISADAIQVTAHGDRVPPMVGPGEDAEAAARRVQIGTAGSSPLMY